MKDRSSIVYSTDEIHRCERYLKEFKDQRKLVRIGLLYWYPSAANRCSVLKFEVRAVEESYHQFLSLSTRLDGSAFLQLVFEKIPLVKKEFFFCENGNERVNKSDLRMYSVNIAGCSISCVFC